MTEEEEFTIFDLLPQWLRKKIFDRRQIYEFNKIVYDENKNPIFSQGRFFKTNGMTDEEIKEKTIEMDSKFVDWEK